MLPLVPTLVLAFVSFISSAFVILRIVIPILPPHPLSRRVPPSEFGLPNFKTLSPADKSHIWLASCDIIALAVFVWQALSEYFGGASGYGVVNDPGSAVRLWIATTLRQSCLLTIATITLAHVRMGQPVAFGKTHWMLWAPTLLLAATSTGLAGVLAGAGVESFFWGLFGYSSALAITSTISFVCLIGTLFIIRRNLAALSEIRNPWPPVESENQIRYSFSTEDINALKDGSSWITSRASSRCESLSAFSFSTHHTRAPSNASSHVQIHPNLASHPSIPPKSSFWFNPATPSGSNGRESPIPPVPPLPAPYRPSTPSTYNVNDDPDPFRRVDPRIRLGSQSSWLTENPGWQYERSMSEFSFPPSPSPCGNSSFPSSPDLRADLLTATPVPSADVSRPRSIVNPDVLGGYGYAPDAVQAENNGITTSIMAGSEVDVSIYRAIGWMVLIWIPTGLVLPYAITTELFTTSNMPSFLLVLSVTLSSPILAANILLRSPIPIPIGLFDSPSKPPSVVMRAPSPASSTQNVRGFKLSGSTTIVEDRRSGDVWLAHGDAVEGKSKIARALTLLQPKPKLSVLPSQEEKFQDGRSSTPSSVQDISKESAQSHVHVELGTHKEMGTRKKDSKASSYYSGTDDSVACATRIMIAQRHYSAAATTLILPPSPDRRAAPETAATTAVDVADVSVPDRKRHSHLRARSVSSINSIPRSPISLPPDSPLPPTPPTLKNFKAASASRRLAHRKSYSSTADEFSFGFVDSSDYIKEIDALSAGLLPLLIPGLTISQDMKITEGWKASPLRSTGDKQRRSHVPTMLGDISADFPSIQTHSTPRTQGAQTKRTRKTSSHKHSNFSLSSLGLDESSSRLSTSFSEITHTSDTRRSRRATVGNTENRKTTVYGNEPSQYLMVVTEEDEGSRPGSPNHVPGILDGLDAPTNIDSSIVTLISALDQELQVTSPSTNSEATLFDFDPRADGVLESTPQESKIKPMRHSRNSEITSLAPVASSKASRRSGIMYFKSDEASLASGFMTMDLSGRASPVVRPLAPKRKGSKDRLKKTVEQENVTPTFKGLRPLSLLRDRDYNNIPVPETRPLSIGKHSKKARAADSENDESLSHASSSKRALKPLKLTRNETTKQRAILRENEVLPDVVVRPPSDGQHIGLSYKFR